MNLLGYPASRERVEEKVKYLFVSSSPAHTPFLSSDLTSFLANSELQHTLSSADDKACKPRL